MSFSLAIRVLCFTGILNCRKNGIHVEISKLFLILNILKLCALIALRKPVYELMVENLLPSYYQISWTQFSIGFLQFFCNYPIVQAELTIFLLSVLSSRIVRIINEIIDLWVLWLEKCPSSKVLFEDYKKSCFKNISLSILLCLAFHSADFILTMQMSFLSFFAFWAFVVPHYVSILMLCFVYTIIQFIIYAQRALNVHAQKASSNDMESITSDISMMRSALYSIKEYFISSLCIPILTMTFYYISQIVCQVNLINCRLDSESHFQNNYFQIFLATAEIFTMKNASMQSCDIPLSTMILAIPFIILIVFCFFIPCENIKINEEKLVVILLKSGKFLKQRNCCNSVRNTFGNFNK